MSIKLQRTVNKFRNELKNHNIPFDQIYIFGSAARGTQHKWSDIDIAVIGPSFGEDRIEEVATLRMIAYEINPALSPIPLRPEDMRDRFSTIGAAIRREGIEA